jgi:hypothetical protein
MTLVTMSDKEFSRLQVLHDVAGGRLTISEATALLHLTRRQFFRLQRAFRRAGPEGLVSRRRGRSGNRRSPPTIRKYALATIREWYADFGPTLAAEKLAGCHGLALSRETLQRWMICCRLGRSRHHGARGLVGDLALAGRRDGPQLRDHHDDAERIVRRNS